MRHNAAGWMQEQGTETSPLSQNDKYSPAGIQTHDPPGTTPVPIKRLNAQSFRAAFI
jgi:hypothetical protein